MGKRTDWQGRTIGDRYRVVEHIGEGGMATVLRAEDASSGEYVALKVLTGAGQSGPAAGPMGALFVQEFHALSQLSHPRIVRVLDYGVDEVGPYYAMELLDGGDLRSQSPMDWRSLCGVLRDVCSALSLLHSRQLVHRDITPANIRCTRDGQAKLIDLGAVTQVGPCPQIVGTPAFLAPEALNDHVVDARTDLYALGATAYRALTGRHAYPGRALSDLPSLWAQPLPSPADFVPDLPPALDELVMSLLALQPVARPESAAEVMERAIAIGDLQADEQLLVRSAFLSTPAVVGRERESRRFQRRLERVLGGAAELVVVTGGPGSGRTRFMTACGVAAQVHGAKLLAFDAGHASGGDWAALVALTDQLRERVPVLVERAAEPELATLASVAPALAARLSNGPPVEAAQFDSPQARRAAVSDAFHRLFDRVAREQPLLLAIDDARHVDASSAAVLASLTRESGRLMVLATVEPAALASDTVAGSWLEDEGRALHMHPFERRQTTALLRSVFGDVPNVRWLADQVHTMGQGVPGATMRMAQHLVDSGVVHYSAGQWAVPAKLAPDALPARLFGTLAERLERLDPLALNLAAHLAAATFPSLSLEECFSLLAPHPAQAVLAAVDELVAAEVCALAGPSLLFENPGVQAAMAERLTGESLSAIHRALADVLMARPDAAVHEVIHRERGGQPDVAFERVLSHMAAVDERLANDPPVYYDYVQTLPTPWLEAFRRILAWAGKVERPLRERTNLLAWIVYFGSADGRTVQEEALELARRLRVDSGLSDYDDMADLAPEVRLQRALACAQQRYDDTSEHERGLAPLEAIRGLTRMLLASIGLAGRSLDRQFLATLPSLEPFAALSPALAVVDMNRRATLHALAGQFGAAHGLYQQMLERMEAPGNLGLEPAQFNLMRAAVMWAVGTLEITMGQAQGIRYADALAASPLFEVNTSRMRALHAMKAGKLAAAERHQRKVELLRMRNDPPQLFQGTYDWAEAQVYASSDDLSRMKQLLPSVTKTAQQFPCWKPCELFVRGQYQRLRGDLRRALPLLERGLAMTGPGVHLAWAPLAGAVVMVLRQLGRADEAIARAREWLALAHANGLSGSTRYLEHPLALALADTGELDEGIAIAEGTIAALTARGDVGIALGDAHFTRARLAIVQRDAIAFEHHAGLCADLYRMGENPVLSARCERLRRAFRKAAPDGVSGVLVASSGMTGMTGAPASSLFEGCRDRAERAQRALAALMERDGCLAGALFLMTESGPMLAARAGDVALPEDMDKVVAERVAAELDLDEHTVLTGVMGDDSGAHTRTWTGPDGRAFVPLVIGHAVDHYGLTVTGVAVLCVPNPAAYRPPYQLIGVMSTLLSAAGDVPARAADQASS